MRRREDISFDFGEETRKALGKKAVVFDDGFDEFQGEFIKLDEFLEQEKDVVQGVQGPIGYNGVAGATGIQGATGLGGCSGELNRAASYYGSYDGYNVPKRSRYKEDEKHEETVEDKAIARIYTLRSTLEKYMRRVEELRKAVRILKEEKRRLRLISRNVGSDRTYKLDINKLSAFGFENIE